MWKKNKIEKNLIWYLNVCQTTYFYEMEKDKNLFL